MKKLFLKFKAALGKSQFIDKDDEVYIAFSGGPDSVFLAHMLMELKNVEIKVGLVYVNHSLRGSESDEEEEFVTKFALKHSLPLIKEKVDVRKYAEEHKKGIEESARELRYNIFDKVKCDKVALAHNMDDNIETFLFRLIRGSSLKGLRSIPQKRGRYFRPILQFEKKEILAFLDSGGIEYFQDSSNFKEEYTRNKIRLGIVPKLEGINPNVRRSISALIEEINSLAFKEIGHEKRLELDNVIGKGDREVENIIHDYISQYTTSSRSKVDQVKKILSRGGSATIDLGGGYIAKKGYSCIDIFKKKKNRKIEEKILEIGKRTEVLDKYIEIKKVESFFTTTDKNLFLLDMDKLLDKNLSVRGRRDGDRFSPLGMSGSKKLNRYLMDIKLSSCQRDQIPLICCNDEIVWVVGYRGSEQFKATKDSKNICLIQSLAKEEGPKDK